MPDNKGTIRIESILGGHSPTTHFASKDQFGGSIGIDPSLPFDYTSYERGASGLIRPSVSNAVGGSTIANAPLWIRSNPKDGTVFVYDAGGSVYTYNGSVIDDLADLNDEGSSHGNGMAYYDNYIYFATDTNVARYGPLNGTPTFTDSYWVSTLSKTRLTNPVYPNDFWTGVDYPNHILHRHSDGKLYIADVVDNKGTIHYIATTKSSVEGDTDNGSTYNKVQVGYGLWPTAVESYGSDLAIAFFENDGDFSSEGQLRAKLAFWDTTSTNVNKITWVEFPDPIVSALKNINGVLYAFSGTPGAYGTRLTRFVGGYTFEEVGYYENFQTPYQGGTSGESQRLLFGTVMRDDIALQARGQAEGVVASYGLQKSGLSNGTFVILGAPATNVAVTAIWNDNNTYYMKANIPYIGYDGDNISGFAVPHERFESGTTYGDSAAIWWSQIYRIGQPFKITKIRIPVAKAIASGMTVNIKVYTDEGSYTGGQSYVGNVSTLTAIDNSTDSGKLNIVRRSDSSGNPIVGQHCFWLELRWTGTDLCTVALPITIEYELIDD